ncbi:MAG: hypothetical protein AAFP70_12800 [Calditrichota bacterium]
MKLLFICGTLNQTTQMHQISKYLSEYDLYFTPHYADGLEKVLSKLYMTEFTVIGHKLVARCMKYLEANNLQIDVGGKMHRYDLIVTCSDMIVQKNILDRPVVLVQEGITDPEKFTYHLVKALPFLPRWIAGTSVAGLGHSYDAFCVASEGYRNLFISKGVKPEKLHVTGIPNFDNCQRFYENDFPYKDYVLVCTSDLREKLRFENRQGFIEESVRIAAGRQLIFKLHPNENVRRATAEIERFAPGALVYSSGSAEEMIANCDVLITSYSTTVFVGLALGKEVYSKLDMAELKRLTPLQNGGSSAKAISHICRDIMYKNIEKQESL